MKKNNKWLVCWVLILLIVIMAPVAVRCYMSSTEPEPVDATIPATTVVVPDFFSDGMKEVLSDYAQDVECRKLVEANHEAVLKDILKTNCCMVGRLYIPSIEMEPVACYDGISQFISDGEDSANFFFYNDDVTVISDHVSESFPRLKTIQVGAKAYLDCGDTIYVLQCLEVIEQTKIGHYGSFNDVFGMEDLTEYMVIYTCNGWPNVTATRWEVIEGGTIESIYSRLDRLADEAGPGCILTNHGKNIDGIELDCDCDICTGANSD